MMLILVLVKINAELVVLADPLKTINAKLKD